MPIKTIQPFVSNFNAFAGEGFYGNVVQGLVIKQLEDTVFLFGIAIDGTLIFRKRNYPDVSTWEDPKIIIHSNNWHKIYFVTDLGGLLQVSSVGEIDLKPNVNVSMKLREGIYAFYDNYAISGFILTVSDNIYTDRSKIIAGEKSASLSIEFGSNGVTFQSNACLLYTSPSPRDA